MATEKSPSASTRNYNRRQLHFTNQIDCSPLSIPNENNIQFVDDQNVVDEPLTKDKESISNSSVGKSEHSDSVTSGSSGPEDHSAKPPLEIRDTASVEVKDNEPKTSMKKKAYGAVVTTHNVFKERDDAQHLFKNAIMNPGRNAMFTKVVNDKIIGENCVVGLSDDLMIRFDKDRQQFRHWIVTDHNCADHEYNRTINTVNRLPQILYGTHVEGVAKLELLLDKLVVEHQDYVESY